MDHPLEQQICDRWPPAAWSGFTVLVAVSGGADSVALLRALLALRQPGAGRLIAAHFNHRLRGAESEGDERFVRELSGSLGVECEVGRAGRSSAGGSGEASEAAFRRARYRFLRQAAAKHGARYVVTAHTADDQAETVLHRILRGTGVQGLRGIQPFRELMPGVALARPMLSVRRQQVLDYLAACWQPFREDSSNQTRDYTRNRLRLELIPALGQFNAAVVPALTRLAALAGETQQVIDDQVEQLWAAACSQSGDRVAIDCRTLSSVRPLLVRELFASIWKRQGWPRQAMSHARWEQLAALAAGDLAQGARRQAVLPGGVVAERTSDRLLLAPGC